MTTADAWSDVEIAPDEAAQWSAAGFDPEEADAWREAGFTVDEAPAWWDVMGGDHFKARAWREAGFSLGDAKEWMAEGFQPEEAEALCDAGFTAEDAAWECIETGLDPLELAELR